jgi:hypothetical protein
MKGIEMLKQYWVFAVIMVSIAGAAYAVKSFASDTKKKVQSFETAVIQQAETDAKLEKNQSELMAQWSLILYGMGINKERIESIKTLPKEPEIDSVTGEPKVGSRWLQINTGTIIERVDDSTYKETRVFDIAVGDSL